MNYKVINKKGVINVVLIHGLFATAGYWLNYLEIFKNCKLIILEIDYFNSKSLKDNSESLEHIIINEFNNKIDYIFSHSLGTIIANGLSDINFKHSFEICPVYNSNRVSKFEFISKILEKTNLLYTLNNIEKILSNIDIQVYNYKSILKFSNKRTLFYPNNDIYFNYDHKTIYSFNIFNGDHFEINNALKDSFKFINNLYSK
jgi:hypothetical protein